MSLIHLPSFACGYPFVQEPFVEETVLSVSGLGPLVEKSVRDGSMGLFLDSQFYSVGLYVYPCASTSY